MRTCEHGNELFYPGARDALTYADANSVRFYGKQARRQPAGGRLDRALTWRARAFVPGPFALNWINPAAVHVDAFMLGVLVTAADWRAEAARSFAAWLAEVRANAVPSSPTHSITPFVSSAVEKRELGAPDSASRLRSKQTELGGGPVLILGHFDADGLAAVATLKRALDRAGVASDIRLVGRGENPWDDDLRPEWAARAPAGLIVADLGVREGALAPGVPTLVIDHHRPTGTPGDALVLSGHGVEPEPSTALIAWHAASAVADVDDLLWLAALGLIGDMREDHPEVGEAGTRFGKTALRDAVSLINAPRRTAAADAGPALRLLLECDGPKAIVKGDGPDQQALQDAKAEVKSELDVARKVAPRVGREVALIRFHSPCQIHPLVAQQWRGRLKDKIVLAANTGYRPGWVHFAARSATGRDLIDFLAAHRPPGADSHYGSGHAEATGGALRAPDWNAFVSGLGFPDQQVPL